MDGSTRDMDIGHQRVAGQLAAKVPDRIELGCSIGCGSEPEDIEYT